MNMNMNMNMYFISDIVGIIGVSFIIIAFFLLQNGKIMSSSMFYLLCNLAGSILILLSLFYHWNLASVIIEILWCAISIYGIVKAKFFSKQ